MGRRRRHEFEELDQAWGRIGRLYQRLRDGLIKAQRDVEDLDIILADDNRLLEKMIESVRFETRFRRGKLVPVDHHPSTIIAVLVHIRHTHATSDDLIAWMCQNLDCRLPLTQEIRSLKLALEKNTLFTNAMVLENLQSCVYRGHFASGSGRKAKDYKSTDNLPMDAIVLLVKQGVAGTIGP